MAEVEPQRLPPFLDAALPFGRSAYVLERGADRGRRLHLIDHGHRMAQVVLLLHGNPTWSFLWRKVIGLLPPRRFRCVAPDLLGFGLSDKLPAPADHSVDRHLEALCELVEALDLQRCVLVGQDWGGPLATGLGARLPERVAGLVLANTSVLVPARPRGTAFHRFARLPLLSDLAFRLTGFPMNVLHRLQGDRGSIQGDVAAAYRWPLRRVRDRAGPLGLARMVPSGPDHPSVPALRRGEAWARAFQGPVALVWGEKDPLLGRALRRHEEAFPQARVTRTQAGHFLQEEVPEALVEAIEWVTGKLQ
jgi:pimeloyl-ACP methyl ester carboxylesterase